MNLLSKALGPALTIILNYLLIVWSIKCQKILKNDHHNFLKPKVMPSNCSFGPTNSSKPKDIQFTIIQDKEKQQILRIQKLEKDLKYVNICQSNSWFMHSWSIHVCVQPYVMHLCSNWTGNASFAQPASYCGKLGSFKSLSIQRLCLNQTEQKKQCQHWKSLCSDLFCTSDIYTLCLSPAEGLWSGLPSNWTHRGEQVQHLRFSRVAQQEEAHVCGTERQRQANEGEEDT